MNNLPTGSLASWLDGLINLTRSGTAIETPQMCVERLTSNYLAEWSYREQGDFYYGLAGRMDWYNEVMRLLDENKSENN